MGRLDAARGRTRRAGQRYARALDVAEASDDLRTQSLAREYRTELLLDTGHPEEAAAELERAKNLADQVGAMTDLTAEIRRVQARLAAHSDSPARALKFIAQGLETARRTGDRYEEARFLVLRAEVRAREGNPRAGTRFQQAIEQLSHLGMRHPLAQTLVRYANWMADTGSGSPVRDRVQECLIVASEILERMGDVRGLADAQISLAEWKLRQGGIDGALAILRSIEEMDFVPGDGPDRIVQLRQALEECLVSKIQSPAPEVPWTVHFDMDRPEDVQGPADFLERLAASVGADRALWVRPGQAGPDARVLAGINVGEEEAGVIAGTLMDQRSPWMRDPTPVLSVSASTDERFHRAEWIRDVRSVLLYPLVSGGSLRGLLYLDRGRTRGLPFGGSEMEKVSAAGPIMESLATFDEPPGDGKIRIATPSGVKTVPYILGGAKLTKVLAVVGRVCNSNVPILIHGETGTGKELVAKALHALGQRQSGPFVAQNCAAIPRELLESELFGYVSGAFTGAVTDKTGLFEAAHGGTFLLDEIAEMDAATQVKLLRLLETGEVRRLGAVSESSVDVRVVSATHRRLDEEVATGSFREDLFYRLNVVSLELPPLRERASDIPILAGEFLGRSFAQEKKPPGRLSAEALEILAGYSWPGNVRELENEMKRLGALASGGSTLHPNMLSSRIRLGQTDPAPTRLCEKMHSVERREILTALEAEGWNLSRAARSLGNMPRSTLASRMKRLGIRR
jgi:transcriptional regulator with GAF, ATPase, and Fis domain